MPTISVLIVRKPRVTRTCVGVSHQGSSRNIPAGKPQVRMFGSATGVDPYPVFLCLDCARKLARSCRKTADALDDFDNNRYRPKKKKPR